MLELQLPTGVRLVLPREAEADIDLLEPAIGDDVEESYSLPFTLPIAGNERALGMVHMVELADRVLTIDDVRLWHNGTPLHTGTLNLLGTVPGGVNASFSVDGFVALYKDIHLKDCDYGAPRFAADMVEHAKEVNDGTYPEKEYCFPTFFNKDFYGSNNPTWYPSASAWVAGNDYDTDDIVEYSYGDVVRRTFLYQATADSQTGNPQVSAQWRRTAFGICNHWDHENDTFFKNTVDGQNYYNLVPCLYLKFLVQRAAAKAGLTAVGEWMADERHHRAHIMGNRALDNTAMANFFRVGRLSDYTVSGASTDIVNVDDIANDESTGDFEDTDNVYNTSTFRYTPLAAGIHQFRFYWKWTGVDFPGTSMPNDDSDPGYIANIYGAPGGFRRTNDDGTQEEFSGFTVEFDASAVGQTFYFRKQFYGTTVIHAARIHGWKEDNPDIAGNDTEIDLKQHVPDLSIGELMQHVRDLFCLRLRVNRAEGKIHFDYRKNLLNRTPRSFSDRRIGPINIEFDRRNRGYTFRFDTDTADTLPDLTQISLVQTVDSEADLDPAPGPRVYAVARNTRAVFLPVRPEYFSPNNWVWQNMGTLPSTASVGQAASATEVVCAFKPPPMERYPLNGEVCLMPVCHQSGNSAYFNMADNPGQLWVSYFHGLVENGNGAFFPISSPYCYNEDGTDLDLQAELDWIGEFGLYDNEWSAWANAMYGAEPVTTDLRLTHADLAQRTWQDPLEIDHQIYLPVRLPVKHGRGPLLARGCELLLLKPPTE